MTSQVFGKVVDGYDIVAWHIKKRHKRVYGVPQPQITYPCLRTTKNETIIRNPGKGRSYRVQVKLAWRV